MSLVISLALAVLGFALLAMSQDQHRRTVGARPLAPRARTACRVASHFLLLLTLPILVWSDGPGFGTLLWATLLSVAACTVTFTLSWQPKWLSSLARGKTRQQTRYVSLGVDP